MKKNVLIVSSDHTFASLLERELGEAYEIHSASTDLAAFALLDSYNYVCLVVDLSPRSVAGNATVTALHLRTLTMPCIALVPPDFNLDLPRGTIICAPEHDPVGGVADVIRKLV